jgi:hypothetical protein
MVGLRRERPAQGGLYMRALPHVETSLVRALRHRARNFGMIHIFKLECASVPPAQGESLYNKASSQICPVVNHHKSA